MKLETTVAEIKSTFHINHKTPVFLIGSCFSAVFGRMLSEKKVPAQFNPFGTVYNPVSIAKMIQNIMGNKVPEANEIQERNKVFYHFDYHSDMSALTRNEVIENIKIKTENAFLFLQSSRILFITLGTSIVYQTKENEKIVANCHKVQGSDFLKKMLSIEEMVAALSETIDMIISKFPGIQVVFTISPVRHIRDGLIENNRSKARLIETVHTLEEKYGTVTYFPSYELVMDQLRDYRYYEKDLIHPNEMAHDILWEYFSNTYFTDTTRNIFQRIEKLSKAFQHIPQFNNHPDYVSFCKKQLEEIELLENTEPILNFTNEKSHFKRVLNDLIS